MGIFTLVFSFHILLTVVDVVLRLGFDMVVLSTSTSRRPHFRLDRAWALLDRIVARHTPVLLPILRWRRIILAAVRRLTGLILDALRITRRGGC